MRRILLTNDDGIHAPGLKALESIARKLDGEVWVVAPESEQSAASHSLSLNEPLRLRRISPRKYAVRGTPADCVLMAVKRVMPEAPTLVLSGVNSGQNVADDITYSGTIAGAMEGAILQIPSIALSQVSDFNGGRRRWTTAVAHGPDLIRALVAAGWPRGVLINVNFPDVPPGAVSGVEVTRQGEREQSLVRIGERVDGRGKPYYWIGYDQPDDSPAAGTDLRAVREGRISVTPLHMNLTHARARRELEAALGPARRGRGRPPGGGGAVKK